MTAGGREQSTNTYLPCSADRSAGRDGCRKHLEKRIEDQRRGGGPRTGGRERLVPSKTLHAHLNVSASRTWQLAWCSNWSSSHRKFWQKEQRNILPPVVKGKTATVTLSTGPLRQQRQRVPSSPCSHTLRSHSTQSASDSGQLQAWLLKHFLPWQTHASQKSHTAP